MQGNDVLVALLHSNAPLPAANFVKLKVRRRCSTASCECLMIGEYFGGFNCIQTDVAHRIQEMNLKQKSSGRRAAAEERRPHKRLN
eukprot:scaffold1187_cov181-Ochromonas_danica.AAC.10